MSACGSVALQLLFRAMNPQEHHRPAIELRLYSGNTEGERPELQYTSATVSSNGVGDLITHVLCFYDFTLPSKKSYHYDVLLPSGQKVQAKELSLSEEVYARKDFRQSKEASMSPHPGTNDMNTRNETSKRTHVSDEHTNSGSIPVHGDTEAGTVAQNPITTAGWCADNTPHLLQIKQIL